jgi:hypothetical protein
MSSEDDGRLLEGLSEEAASPPRKKVRLDGVSRAMVDSIHLATLMASYHHHFGEYSNGRKHATKQIIPSKVWRKVYQSYKEVHTDSSFDEETLKKRVRETLEQLQTGTSNTPDTPAALQSSEILKRIKETNGHATRNLISLRHTLINSSSDDQGRDFADNGHSVRPQSSSTSRGASVITPTKKEYLRQQADTLEKMSNDFASSIEMQKLYMNTKRKTAELASLKLLLDAGVLTKVEFSEQARKLMEPS